MGNETQSAGNAAGMKKSSQEACMKPKCPYYQDTGSELVCPYFMMSNHLGPGGAPGANGRTNWAGIASLILGIISISMCWLSILLFPAFIFIVLAILGITFGGLGLRNGFRARTGKAAAIAGLILGILALIFSILLLMIRLAWGYY
ncbi:MAG: DUF4190 domain-containing protein [Candidatus Thermoplasmatota archaeon]|nr:DUF4190 domain-containing protein [Euryarchaeota archaeon]MBU4032237.1 DUF4190 domain-containing protein [Candidatus Thermoplasmatota archaeon]MBU4071925.1 DUF4190 domain-containing protein [Candidatus Thermoplasmatota archaeon]MBU4144430.1 DUF4190 domain-containing protein [Candidatus Thermoplasmatota archaeon]MBU4591090.1 DUF4190 domain-containing protein [Candidatus Thermoplasmatota archaeon]